jgi:hypothetical protein
MLFQPHNPGIMLDGLTKLAQVVLCPFLIDFFIQFHHSTLGQ